MLNGSYNTDMLIGFQGCLSQRVPSLVTGEEDVTNFSLAELADGFYFVKIVAKNSVLVKQVIKK